MCSSDLSLPSISQDDASKLEQEDTGLAQPRLSSTPPIPPTSVPSPPVQSQAPASVHEVEERREERKEEEEVSSSVPSVHPSPIIAPNIDDTATPPAVPVNRPPSLPLILKICHFLNMNHRWGPVRIHLHPTFLTHSIFLTQLTRLTCSTHTPNVNILIFQSQYSLDLLVSSDRQTIHTHWPSHNLLRQYTHNLSR